jgi:hypothetical protein
MGGAAEHPQRHLVGRVELKEMPTQTLLRAPARWSTRSSR